MRMNYLKKMHELCPIGSQTLLITLEYEPNLDSPPFSITPKDVEAYYGEHYEINHVEQPNLPEHRMKIKLNLDFLKEHCFILTKRRH
jgi:thiopurine S-methyltransferase